MVIVFKTNVSGKAKADRIIKELTLKNPQSVISFDLGDCDKILRIEALIIDRSGITEVLEGHHVRFRELPIVL